MRRLPVYLLIDTSGSMKGEPIESVKVGLDTMVASLRNDPFALESAAISIITYDKDVKVVLPLTMVEDVQIPDIVVPESGPTNMGAALKLLCKQIENEVHLSTPTQKGDWMPLLFLMTDGKPSDIQEYNEAIPMVKSKNFATIVACAAGPKAKADQLKSLTDRVYTLDTMDMDTFKQFFQWVSVTIQEGNRSIGNPTDIELPPAPAEVNFVL